MRALAAAAAEFFQRAPGGRKLAESEVLVIAKPTSRSSAQQAVLRCPGRFNISRAPGCGFAPDAAGRPNATRERSANRHHSIQFGAAASNGAETDAELHKQAFTGRKWLGVRAAS
jgi:hypothetical protein